MEELKDLIICPRCQKVHKKVSLKKGEVARCSSCKEILYKDKKNILTIYLSFSVTALIFLFISTFFPIIDINLSLYESSLNIIEAILSLFENGYLFVGLFSFFVLLLFPFLVLSLLFLASLFMKLKIFKNLTKWFLIIVSFLTTWSMLDIFFISILVASVKIFDYATINLNVAFFSLVIYMILEIYLTKHIRVFELWDEWEEIYE